MTTPAIGGDAVAAEEYQRVGWLVIGNKTALSSWPDIDAQRTAAFPLLYARHKAGHDDGDNRVIASQRVARMRAR